MKHLPIEPLTPADLPAALELWTNLPGVGLNESDTIPRLEMYLARNPGLSLVVRDGDQIVAAVLCGHDGRRGALNHLAVAAAYRNQGIGRRMVDHCTAALGQLGIWKCNILVYANNAAGQRFWEQCGYFPRPDLLLRQAICPLSDT